MPLAQVAVGDTAEAVLFAVFAVIALGSGMGMVMMRNIVHGALLLVVNFLSIAALFLLLQSSFLAIGQVIVYAGAIMVLFLFVIMLLGVDRDDLLAAGSWRVQAVAVLGVAAIAGVLLFGFVGAYTGEASLCGAQAPAAVTRTADSQPCAGLDDQLAGSGGAVGVLADRMFGRYTFPFEAAAVLLTVATVGAMVLGRRTDPDQDDDPAWAVSGPVPDETDVADREEAEREHALASTEAASLSGGGDRPLVTDDPDVVEAQRQREPEVERGSEPEDVERGSEPEDVERGSEPVEGEDA